MDLNQRNKFLCLTLQTILDHAKDMIFVKDKNLIYVAGSDSFAKMVGLEKGADLIGKTDFDVFPKDLAAKYTKDDMGILHSETDILEYVEPLPDNNGKKSYSSTSKFLLRDENHCIIGIYGIARDITLEMELETERERNRLSRQIFDCVLEADITENRLLRFEGPKWVQRLMTNHNRVFAEASKTFAEQVIRRDYREEFVSHYEIKTIQKAYKEGNHEFSYLTLIRTEKDSGYHWVECISRLYHSDISNTLRITIFLKDIDDEMKNRQLLMRKASTDALTGLYNRASLLEQISNVLKESGERHQHALLFIDLDRFKQINDSLGHQFGDRMLKSFAEKLRQAFREDDILGRLGGDEFVVFLRQISSVEAVKERAEQVLCLLNISYSENGHQIQVTCSIGVALCQGGTMGLESLYQQADQAMYQAKSAGKNCVCFYHEMQENCEKKGK